MNVTPEVIDALHTLREGVWGGYVSESVAKAIIALDNADVFAEIDQEAWELSDNE